MSTLTLPFPDFQPNTIAASGQVDANNAAIVAVVNGGLDDTNLANNGITASTKIKDGTIDAACMGTGVVRQAQIDYTAASLGPLVAQTGPNYVGANGARLAWVSKSITPTVVTEEDYTFTFASDCISGDPAFTATPAVGCPTFIRNTDVEAEMPDAWWFKSVTSTTAVLRIKYYTTAAATAMTVQFPVYGAK